MLWFGHSSLSQIKFSTFACDCLLWLNCAGNMITVTHGKIPITDINCSCHQVPITTIHPIDWVCVSNLCVLNLGLDESVNLNWTCSITIFFFFFFFFQIYMDDLMEWEDLEVCSNIILSRNLVSLIFMFKETIMHLCELWSPISCWCCSVVAKDINMLRCIRGCKWARKVEFLDRLQSEMFKNLLLLLMIYLSTGRLLV